MQRTATVVTFLLASAVLTGSIGSHVVSPSPAREALDALAQAEASLLALPLSDAARAAAVQAELVNIATARDILATSDLPSPDTRALRIAELALAGKTDLLAFGLDPTLQPLFDRQVQNIADARESLRILDDIRLSSAQKAAALTRLASEREIAGADLGTVLATSTSIVATVTTLAASHGYVLTLHERQALAALDARADHAEVAQAIEAFAAFERTVTGPLPVHLLARASLIDAAGRLEAAAPTSAACSGLPIPEDATLPGIIELDLEGCLNTHARDFVFTIDLGGEDVYTNNAGGNGYGADPCLETEVHPAGALIDLAGDDRYVSGRACGVNGGAIGGSGFLYDAAGDDVYLARGLGTNGGGHAGHGLLLDLAGDDNYTATEKWGTNGGGFVGVGLLIDLEGVDVYTADASGTNGGAEIGAGLLIDGAGTDTYDGGSRATNGGAYLGTGFLLDASQARDLYLTADGVYGTGVGKNGGGASAGTGFLFDEGGDDWYVGGDSGSNGGGWYGVGFLIDVSGDDQFDGGENGVNGAGWALPPGSHFIARSEIPPGAGFLVDLSGDDNYTSEKFGTNGGCYIGSSFLFDGEGDDFFHANGGGGVNGGAGGKAKGLCPAFFMNQGGDDQYITEFDGDIESPSNPRVSQFHGGDGANGGVGGVGGLTFFFEIGGDDFYQAHKRGVNGGGMGGMALLLDTSGHDTYEGTSQGVNGGGYTYGNLPTDAGFGLGSSGPGVGFLFDLSGDDTYIAHGASGTNGGTSGPGAFGLLYDRGGLDTYEDNEGGSGTDVTVMPKGLFGAQIDA